MASAVASSHHPENRHQARLGRWQAHQMMAGRHAVRVATALTAPISATAIPARAASSRAVLAPSPRMATITGSSTHGASIMGRVSDEIEPSVVSTRGDSAKAAAATTREDVVPIPSASATRSRPQKPTASSSAHHRRWVTQPGRPTRSPARKNAPCGKR